jgi:hypothetical protein
MSTKPCDECGREVRYVKTGGGKWVCVDPEPDDAGTVILTVDQRDPWAVAIVFPRPSAARAKFGDRSRYRLHKETCRRGEP